MSNIVFQTVLYMIGFCNFYLIFMKINKISPMISYGCCTCKAFEELEKSRHRILSLTKKFAAHELNLQPAPGQWSMAQVIKHLAITETQILEYVKKRMTKDTLPDATFKSWMRYMTVSWLYGSARKLKRPDR
jgi:hypothetical protein